MNNLLPGLRNFSENIFPQHQNLFETLSLGQKPHTLMITCSDSRIDPNLVTQTTPGELFILRNAGNIIPKFGLSKGGEEAAIEFAIDGLGVSNVVICGHSKCGPMAALLNPADLVNLPSVKNWLRHADSTKERVRHLGGKVTLSDLVDENVLAQVDNLKTHPSVSGALRSGRIQIYGWVYHFETGTINVYDPTNKRYVPSTEVKEQAMKNSARYAL